MASLAWTSSSVKGDLDVIGCINRRDGTGCSKKGGRSFSGNKLLVLSRYVYIRIIYFREPAQCFDSCFDRHLA